MAWYHPGGAVRASPHTRGVGEDQSEGTGSQAVAGQMERMGQCDGVKGGSHIMIVSAQRWDGAGCGWPPYAQVWHRAWLVGGAL